MELKFYPFINILEANFMKKKHGKLVHEGTRLDRLQSVAWYPIELDVRNHAINCKNTLICVIYYGCAYVRNR